jgi:hypothetical protein
MYAFQTAEILRHILRMGDYIIKFLGGHRIL